MKTVVILQYRLFHYRTRLFELMRWRLADSGVRLEVVYGQPYGKEVLKDDVGRLSWGREVKNIYLPIKEKKDLCWQPLPRDIGRPDLVIFMQENRLLSNYYWIARGLLRGPKVAFWGHGRDFQSRAPGGVRERWKKVQVNLVDWWFAYTEITVNVLRACGFPDQKITLLNNSIDTEGFKGDAGDVAIEVLQEMRDRMGIAEGAPVGLFCGSIYPDKKPDLLVAAADHIRQGAPDFHLVIVGEGQSSDLVKLAAESRPWLHVVGARRGREKAVYFKLASFVLNPGSVGLHVLDAFCLGLPMVTTDSALHGPEIAYMNDGVTGFLSSDDPRDFAGHVLRLIRDPVLYREMRGNCLIAGAKFSVERMADNFVAGIIKCLS